MNNGETVELLGQRVQLVDLSRPLEPTKSEPTPPRVQHISHAECAEMWEFMFGIPPTALPAGLGFAGEIVEASTHASTHLDAPWHYAPTSEGEAAWTIDEIPLHWFVSKAVVLDVSDLSTGYLVTQREIEERLNNLNHTITPGEIVLFRTGADNAVYRFLGGAALGTFMVVIPYLLSSRGLNLQNIGIATLLVVSCGLLSSLFGKRFIAALILSLESSGLY